MELVVFAASLKFFFIEGGEQFIVGAQTAKTIGLKSTLKITLAGVTFAVILFFLLFYSGKAISTMFKHINRRLDKLEKRNPQRSAGADRIMERDAENREEAVGVEERYDDFLKSFTGRAIKLVQTH